MVVERGGLLTARYLLHAPTVSEGYAALWERKRLDLTVEAMILQPEWHALFSGCRTPYRGESPSRSRLLGFASRCSTGVGRTAKHGALVASLAHDCRVAKYTERRPGVRLIKNTGATGPSTRFGRRWVRNRRLTLRRRRFLCLLSARRAICSTRSARCRLVVPTEPGHELELLGSSADRPFRNRLISRGLASRLASWLENKAELREPRCLCP